MSQRIRVLCVCLSASLLLATVAGAQTYFTEVTEEVGLDFPGARNVIFGDYDNDGFQDVFISENRQLSTRRLWLLHNTGDGRFENQTHLIPSELHVGQGDAGAVFGDYDNDGDEDLFLPTFPHNTLLRNDYGSFARVSFESGRVDSHITDHAIWLDYDRDGFLDLYYSDMTLTPENCGCPVTHTGHGNRLLRNSGDGTFTDVTATVGLDSLVDPVFGGTFGGMAAGDFTNDGWPDLYIGAPTGANRLYVSDGQGAFRDASSAEIGEEGEAFGVATGDINNDGNLDILQAAGGQGIREDYSVMLLNLGEGIFTNVSEGVGLGVGALGVNASAVVFADFDNDADLDLVVGLVLPAGDNPQFEHRLLLNEGNGIFVDQTAGSGIHDIGRSITIGDYDTDGFIDVLVSSQIHPVFSPPGARNKTLLYRNNGNSNHWLRVDLVGTQSNRNGIGARLRATSGSVTQIREILGGTGLSQDEKVAHFGLGAGTQVDNLEIRWPSGQVDILTDIPADQKIRVIEGQGRWLPAPRTMWETPPPPTVDFGAEVLFASTVRPALLEPEATITSVIADLSGLGGPESVPLADMGDGTYQLVSQITISGKSDLRAVEVLILQQTSLGEHWIKLSRNVTVTGDPSTAVVERRSDAIPGAFTLAQNYPNPFNPETTIHFDLPLSQDVELAIYNLAAQRVATLVQGYREAGSYSLRWDGQDDGGNALASGVYLYRLTAGELVETRKLLLLR